MKFFIPLFFCLMCSTAFAQSDVVYLKNGTIYKGSVTEYVPEEKVIIKLLDDRVITVPAGDVMRMTVESERVIKNNFPLKEKGYFNTSSVGALVGGRTNTSTRLSMLFNTVNGYKYKNHQIGLGLGIEYHATKWYWPVYADYSFSLFDKPFSPVFGVQGGWLFGVNDYIGDELGFEKGGFVGGRIGFMAYKTPKYAFTLNFTYRYLSFSGAQYSRWSPEGGIYHIDGSAEIHRMGLALGFSFN